MATGDTLVVFTPASNLSGDFQYVAYTSGDTEPTVGDTIWGDTSNETAVLEYYEQQSGTWGGSDSAGFMIFSNPSDAGGWSSGENWTANTTTPSNDGTFTSVPVNCAATFDTANNVLVLDFDATVNEVALFQGVMPDHYDGGGLTITLGVTSTTATGDMSWFIFLKSLTDDVDNLTNVGTDPSGLKVFAAPNTNIAFDAASVAGEVAYGTITFSNGADMDSIAAGELFFLLLMRDAQDGTADDMAADAELVFIKVAET